MRPRRVHGISGGNTNETIHGNICSASNFYQNTRAFKGGFMIFDRVRIWGWIVVSFKSSPKQPQGCRDKETPHLCCCPPSSALAGGHLASLARRRRSLYVAVSLGCGCFRALDQGLLHGVHGLAHPCDDPLLGRRRRRPLRGVAFGRGRLSLL